MAVWIIDDGPLDQLALTLPPLATASWPKGRFVVAEATRTAAKGKRKELLDGSPDTFDTCEIKVGSAAFHVLYGHLRLPWGPVANAAEYQAIAWAIAQRQDAILVTLDKRAAMLGLAELGKGRVAHAFDLWLHLRDAGLVTKEQFTALCEATKRSDQALPGIPLRCSP